MSKERKKIREKLYKEFELKSEALELCQVGTDTYEKLKKDRDDVIKQIDTIDKGENDRMQFIVSVANLVLNLGKVGVGVWALMKSFDFDRTDTFTSTNGSKISNNCVMSGIFH